RNSVPVCARSKQPMLREMAPVKAPFSWPKSSRSASDGEIAPQLIARNGAPARALLLCTVRAMTAFPLPLSPTLRTLASVGAARTTARAISKAGRERPSNLDDGIMEQVYL